MRQTALILLSLLSSLSVVCSAQLRPVSLRTEYAVNPLGIETTRPRFTWLLKPTHPGARGQRQTAYRLEVASSPERLDSGKADLWRELVRSDRQNGIEYAGKALASRQQAWWRVKVWDERGRPGPWSETARWEMGLLKPEDWQARWIGAPAPKRANVSPLAGSMWTWLPGGNPAQSAPDGVVGFRKAFDLPGGPVRSAFLFVAVDNTCRVFVNGREAGGAAGWQTAARVDLKPLLRPGRNVLSILAENGGPNANPAGLAALLRVQTGAGTVVLLPLDGSWKASASPPAGWEQPDFDDRSWAAAASFMPVGHPPWGTPAPPKVPEPAPYLQKRFTVHKPVRRARAYVCGLGLYELYLNGKNVGDRVLEPAQTDYEQRALYTTYDITGYVRKGRQEAGILLGNGWFNQDRVWGGMSYGRPRAICRIEVEYADGSRSAVVSDGSWEYIPSPVRENNLYAGEVYVARWEVLGWTEFARKQGWLRRVEVVSEPTRRLIANALPPIRRIQWLKPKRITRPAPGIAIYDFGQNFAGWAKLRILAPAETEIRMRFAEAVDAKGMLDTASTGVFATGVEQVDRYVCRGGHVEEWEPRFTYHGFRYVEVTGLPGAPKPENLTGVVVHTDVEPIGTFTCSDPMLNRIHRAALWTERSNLHGHPTDCPARERCGWLGDAQITAEMTHYNWDMARFWPKYVGDILTSWRGERPGDVAPGKRGSEPNGHVDWGLAVVLVPWYQYLYTGDGRHLRELYPHMARFVRSVAKSAKDGIIENGYGDWCPPGSVEPTETPPALTTTAWFYVAAHIMERSADALGNRADLAEFTRLKLATWEAFNRRFYNPGQGTYGSQTANAMALSLGLVRPGQEGIVSQSLRGDVMERHDGHLATGIFGSRFLYDALCANGHSDVTWTILHQTTYPSHGDLFAKGATTLWECWGEPELDKKWGARSLNHPMQGGFDAWFYQGLGGIQPCADGPGFRSFTLRPQFMDGLSWANVAYRSASGRIESRWKRSGDTVTWDVVVPPNTEAVVALNDPTWQHGKWTESGKPVRVGRGVLAIDPYGGGWFRLGSGRYLFTVRRQK